VTRTEEIAYRTGFDEGVKYQRELSPPPRVRDLQKQLEAMRERAEAAEARIAEVSGVTREQLAKREYERGLADGAKAVKS